MLQHAREIAPSVSWEILVKVKRSGGMSVNELAAELKMSYMGVKQHCDDLRKQGYVDTWRRPKGTGRPEKIYRPTAKLDLILVNWGSELSMGVLALAAQAYGEAAPERLINGYLQQKVDRWLAKMKGKTVRERAMELVKLRTADGWMCELSNDDQGLRLLDHHSPLAEVARVYPNVWELETRALSKIFGVPLDRALNGNRSELRLPFDASNPQPAPPPVVVVAEPEPEPERNEVSDSVESLEAEPDEVVSPLASGSAWLAPEPLEPEEVESEPVSEFSDGAVNIHSDDLAPRVVQGSTLFIEATAEPEEASDTPLEKAEVPATAPRPFAQPQPVPKPKVTAGKRGESVQADLFDF